MASHGNSSDDGETVRDSDVGRGSGNRSDIGDAPFKDETSLPDLSEFRVSEASTTSWQSLYAAALRESVVLVIPLKIAEAESAILRRMKQIFYSAEYLTERKAIEDAWETLAQLKVSCSSGTDSPRPASSICPDKQAAA